MSECKQKYIEWSSKDGLYCGEYSDGLLVGQLVGTEARLEFGGWEACWNARQAEIDQLKAGKERLERKLRWSEALRNNQFEHLLEMKSQSDRVVGLLRLAVQWREQSKELCRVDDKYVIGSLLGCAEQLEEAVRGEHE